MPTECPDREVPGSVMTVTGKSAERPRLPLPRNWCSCWGQTRKEVVWEGNSFFQAARRLCMGSRVQGSLVHLRNWELSVDLRAVGKRRWGSRSGPQVSRWQTLPGNRWPLSGSGVRWSCSVFKMVHLAVAWRVTGTRRVSLETAMWNAHQAMHLAESHHFLIVSRLFSFQTCQSPLFRGCMNKIVPMSRQGFAPDYEAMMSSMNHE